MSINSLNFNIVNENLNLKQQINQVNYLLSKCDDLNENVEQGRAFEQATQMEDLKNVWNEALNWFSSKPVKKPEQKEARLITYSQQEVQNIADLNNTLGSKFNEFEKQYQIYTQTQDPEIKQTQVLVLLEIEKEFEEFYLQFMASKVRLLEPLIGQTTDQLQQELQEEVNQHSNQDSIREKITVINTTIQDIQTTRIREKEEGLQELTANYLQPLEVEDSLYTQHKNSVQSSNQFSNLGLSKTAKQSLEEANQEINLALDNYSVKLDELRQALRPSDAGFVKEKVEKQCKKLSLELHALRQDFQQTLADASAYKYAILKEVIEAKPASINFSAEETQALMNSLREELIITAQGLKEAARNLRVANQSYEVVHSSTGLAKVWDYLSTEKHEAVQSWSSTPWGQLLAPITVGASLKDIIGAGFKETMDKLKEKRLQLQSQLSLLPQGGVQAKELTQELNHVNRCYYHTLLTRIIDEVGSKQRLLKKHAGELTPQQKTLLEMEVAILNAKYVSCFSKYSDIPVGSQSFLSAAVGHTLDFFKSIASLGFVNDTLASPEDLTREKHYADLGYNMLEDVQGWLKEDLQVKEGETLIGVLKRQVEEFVKWADSDPKTAMALAKDMAQTCAIIGGKDYMDQFVSTMRVKAYGAAFREGWNPFDKQELAITEESLKYYSLSQLFRCAPVLTAVVKSLASNDYSNPIGAAFKTLAEAFKTRAVQQVSDFIPEDHANIALQALNIMRGENFQYMMEEQRNLELVRLSGTAAKFLSSPKDFIKRSQLEAKVWFRTLKESKGLEKVGRIATQILLPLAGVGATIAAATVLAIGGPITWITALTVSFIALSVSFTVARKAGKFFNSIYDTRNNVLANIKREAEETARKAIASEVTSQMKNFIKDLQDKQVLPNITLSEVEFADGHQEVYANFRKEIIDELALVLNTRKKLALMLDATQLVQIYKEVVLDQMREVVTQKTQAADLHYMRKVLSDDVAKFLMEDWLSSNIEQVFTKRTLEFAEDPNYDPSGSIKMHQAEINRQLANLVQNQGHREEIKGQLEQI